MTTATTTRKSRKTTSKENTVTATETPAPEAQPVDNKALKFVVAAYTKASKSAAKSEADLAAAFIAAHQFLADEGNTLRSLEDALGIKRSQIQRHDLAGQALALGNGESDPAVASVVLTVVTAASNRVGIPATREAIAGCESTDQALALLPELKKAPAVTSNEGEGEGEGESDEPDEVDVDEDDFAVSLSQVERAFAQAFSHKPLVAYTPEQKARIDAILASAQALAAHTGNGN